MPAQNKKTSSVLLIIACIFLFHPNVHIIDILPDFIAFFLLSKLLEKPADASPYFEEARMAFQKLCWVNLLKLPALVMVVNLGNMQGDLVALVALSFGVVDLLLSLSAVRYLFDAIFYLGERSSSCALLTPFPVGKGQTLSPEAYRSATYLFVILKCAIATLPEFLRLTRGDSITSDAARYDLFYPITVVLAQILALTVGIVWLVRSVRYIRHTVVSGAFDAAILEVTDRTATERYLSRFHQRMLFSGFTTVVISCFLTFLLRPNGGTPMIPTFLFPLAFTYAAFLLRRYLSTTRVLYILGLGASAASLASFIVTEIFFDTHSLKDMLSNAAARADYLPVKILGGVECALTCGMLICFALSMRALIRNHTGMLRIGESMNDQASSIHRDLSKRALLFSGIGVLTMLARYADVIFYGMPKEIGVGQFEEIQSTITSPMIPWFGTLCGALSVALVLYALYFFSLLKDEVKLHYE